MKDTGERHIIDTEITDEAGFYIHLMHVATYQYALKYVEGKRVLDYGCGSGYGSHILAKKADNVVAVDMSIEAIEYAKNNYSSNNLVFKSISELSDEKFDVITSFQVIEHVPNGKKYLDKLKCLLNPGGCLIISTPNKNNRLFKFIQKPWNIYHLKEYSISCLRNLLQKYFPKVVVLKIGSKSKFVLNEISRTRKQRIVTLPCTLFFYPNSLRVFLLNFQVNIYKMIRRLKKKNKTLIGTQDLQHNFDAKYSVEDIEISDNVVYSTDIFAVCTD
jgi:SAM-dependent methyltransferase